MTERGKPARVRRARNLTLDPSAAASLDAITEAGGNASEYVSQLVVRHLQDWVEALDELEQAGWSRRQILAACDVLNPGWSPGLDPARWQAQSMADGEHMLGRWEIPLETWREGIRQVAQSDRVAVALARVVAEFWAGNEVLAQRLQRDRADPPPEWAAPLARPCCSRRRTA